MKILNNLIKDARDDWLVKTTASINAKNPIVDRIMENESVEVVIMTNHEGVPILKSQMRLSGAINYGVTLHKFGAMVITNMKELDPMEEVLIVRITTKKKDIMIAPDKNFSVIVVQHGRGRSHREHKENNDE